MSFHFLSVFLSFPLVILKAQTTCSIFYLIWPLFIFLTSLSVCHISSWKSSVSMLCTASVSMFSLKLSYVFMNRMCWSWYLEKRKGRELEMEGWSERWVIFSVRHCCFPLSPVIFAHKWMPGSGWKKSLFFCFHIWCNFIMEADCG